VLPTTYAGSEATPVLGETREGQKSTIRSMKVLPEVIVYDVELTYGLPPAISLVSGINAIAHAVEALYAKDANPVTSSLAEQGIAALGRALPRIVSGPTDRSARADALFGAWICGSCLGTVGMSLHHKLCHVLGGGFGLPHAETHTVVLPHAVAYNAAGAPVAIGRVARALGADHAAQALFDLAEANGALLRFARSVCRCPIWTKRRRGGQILVGIRAPSSAMRFGNSWTTPITDAGLLEREEE
jgi:alcohol dehydrogenase class IV